MVRIEDRILGTYKQGDFYVDICVSDDEYGEYEAWLYHKDYGIKYMMFGVLKDKTNVNDFFDLVEATLKFWINIYKQEYCI